MTKPSHQPFVSRLPNSERFRSTPSPCPPFPAIARQTGKSHRARLPIPPIGSAGCYRISTCRSTVCRLQPLEISDLAALITVALEDERGFGHLPVLIDDDAATFLKAHVNPQSLCHQNIVQHISFVRPKPEVERSNQHAILSAQCIG